jgi:glucosamine-6-phosphate deaminase
MGRTLRRFNEKGRFTVKIIRATDYKDMSRKAANLISAQVIMKPNAVLGLATGGTPVGIYAQLIDWYNKGDIDFSQVTTINLDEYRGIRRDNPQSYWYFMHKNFFDSVNIQPDHIHLPDGSNPDAAAACREYNSIIRRIGGIDLQLLGIGPDGHIGFNEPGAAFELETHCVDLTQSTIEANKRFFSSADEVPRQAYTMGIKTIMQARKVLMVASGANKAAIVKQAFFGPVTPQVPASILQMHPDFTLVLDGPAAGEL